ncbi:hypothetical protein Bca101_030468 [Brassica carinata]
MLGTESPWVGSEFSPPRLDDFVLSTLPSMFPHLVAAFIAACVFIWKIVSGLMSRLLFFGGWLPFSLTQFVRLWKQDVGAMTEVSSTVELQLECPPLGSSLGHYGIYMWAAAPETEDRYTVSHMVTPWQRPCSLRSLVWTILVGSGYSANTKFFVSAWKMKTPNLSNESYLVERTHVGNLQAMSHGSSVPYRP